MLSTDQKLDILVEQVLTALYDSEQGDRDWWPINPRKIYIPANNSFTTKLYAALTTLKKTKSLNEIASLTTGNKLAMYTILLGEDTTLSRQKQIELWEIVYDLLAIARNGDPFCETGTNKHYSDTQAKQVYEHLEDSNLPNNQIKRLEVQLRYYCEQIYYFLVPIGMNYHGPYDFGNKTLLIKEYHDLKPEVWDFAQEFPFETYEGIGIYNDLKARINMMGLLNTKQHLPKLVETYQVKIDGKPVTEEELKQINLQVAQVMDKGTKEFKALDKTQVIAKGIDWLHYSIKNLCDAANVNWKPDKKIYDLITDEHVQWEVTEEDKVKGNLELTQALKEEWKYFDPRLKKDPL
ncbi:MAG: hypothetical protein GOV15_02330 [Candidatus Diapherotrites archaeon]|nr:hypothetical protein [Candidatus Diapherotrites archaeon]